MRGSEIGPSGFEQGFSWSNRFQEKGNTMNDTENKYLFLQRKSQIELEFQILGPLMNAKKDRVG